MLLRKINENSLTDERVTKVNRLMSDINDTSDNIYENLMDSDSKLSNHYLNKMIRICEETKTKLHEFLNQK
jgi:hypothetical protein